MEVSREGTGESTQTARPFRAMSVDTVRSGDYQLPKDKPLKAKTAAADTGFGNYGGYGNYPAPGTFTDLPDSDGELPF